MLLSPNTASSQVLLRWPNGDFALWLTFPQLQSVAASFSVSDRGEESFQSEITPLAFTETLSYRIDIGLLLYDISTPALVAHATAFKLQGSYAYYVTQYRPVLEPFPWSGQTTSCA